MSNGLQWFALAGIWLKWFGADRRAQATVRSGWLQEGLKLALHRDEFRLKYEPVYESFTSDLIGFETRLRWHSGEFGVLEPAAFWRSAESAGVARAINRWTLQMTCEDAQRWEQASGRPLMAVCDMPVSRLESPGFVDRVAEVLLETGLAPGRLTLEIPETELNDRMPEVLPVLRCLRALGVGIALDQFGEGECSIQLFREVPIAYLKLSERLTGRIHEVSFERHLVEATISFAHRMGLRVIAGGIAQRRQLSLLQQYRCDALQGNLFGEELAREVVPVWLDRMKSEEVEHDRICGEPDKR